MWVVLLGYAIIPRFGLVIICSISVIVGVDSSLLTIFSLFCSELGSTCVDLCAKHRTGKRAL